MIPGSSGKLGANFFMLVGRMVVYNNMHIQLLQHIGINVAEKLQKLLVAMPFLRLRKNPSRGCHKYRR